MQMFAGLGPSKFVPLAWGSQGLRYHRRKRARPAAGRHAPSPFHSANAEGPARRQAKGAIQSVSATPSSSSCKLSPGAADLKWGFSFGSVTCKQFLSLSLPGLDLLLLLPLPVLSCFVSYTVNPTAAFSTIKMFAFSVQIL